MYLFLTIIKSFEWQIEILFIKYCVKQIVWLIFLGAPSTTTTTTSSIECHAYLGHNRMILVRHSKKKNMHNLYYPLYLFLVQKHSTEIRRFTEQLLTLFGFLVKPNLTPTTTHISTIIKRRGKKGKMFVHSDREREGKA